MKSIRIVIAMLGLLFLTSCQITYYFKSAYNQLSMLSDRVPLEEALKDPKLKEEDKAKLRLAQEARIFAETELGLQKTKNYTSFVQLNRPYVTYVVSASEKAELKHHLWSFPFVGSVPYKGYFAEKDAQAEEADLKAKNLDTYLRGVTAYSTLGWFKDPILSSMLGYNDFDLVNTIIHEIVHATIYIKSSADFNERLATFLGTEGMKLFYQKKEGVHSPTVQKAADEAADEKTFSEFITKEIKDVEVWYKDRKGQVIDESDRLARLAQIQERFKKDIQPKMKTSAYSRFPSIALNNARLMVYKTYLQDMTDFEELFELSRRDFQTFIENCRSLEESKKPEEDLKKLILQLKH